MNTRFLKALLIVKNEQIRRTQTTPVEIYEVGENRRRIVYNPVTDELRCSCPDTPKEKGIFCKHKYAFFIYTKQHPDPSFNRLGLNGIFYDWMFEQTMGVIDGLCAENEELKVKKVKQLEKQMPPVQNKKKKTKVLF